MNNIFPFGSLVDQEVLPQESANEEMYKKEYAFDFEKGEFIQTLTKKIRLDDELEAYRTWALKALLTPRYKHLGYSRGYGQEFEGLIRRGLTRTANESEIKRTVTETLMVNAKTREVAEFQFSWEDDAVFCEFVAVTTRGDRILLSANIKKRTGVII